MQIIKLEDRIIYRASKGKKVEYKGELFNEVVLKEESSEIKEVDKDGNL